jgi:hypothetical protein
VVVAGAGALCVDVVSTGADAARVLVVGTAGLDVGVLLVTWEMWAITGWRRAAW